MTEPKLYCSQLCNEEAHYVRYARAVTRDGRISHADVREALQIRMAWILMGGYPEKARTVKQEVRVGVFARDSARCVECGRPATEIDHHITDTEASINDSVNLRSVCADCHRKKSLSNIGSIQPEAHPVLFEKAKQLQTRIDSSVPLRPCDDEINWQHKWRSIVSERKHKLLHGA